MAIDILEKGDIFFLYRPRVETDAPRGADDVQRLHVVLRPEHEKKNRLLVIGRKRLPDVGRKAEKEWGFVERVATSRATRRETGEETYATKTRGERHQPAARPAGEGVYAIVRHEGHVHLSYRLELPDTPGDVQRELGIVPEASFVLSVKNPKKGSPPQLGLPEEERAELPRHLQERFEDKRFMPLDPPSFLDHEGTEILLVGASDDVEGELDLQLRADRERLETADVHALLELSEDDPRVRRPLTEGEWG